MQQIGFFLLCVFCCMDTIQAQDWPEQWFKPAPKASQLGIKTFYEAPVLTSLVKDGKLPSLEQRLPDDPMVLTPRERSGDYGGVARIFSCDEWSFVNLENLLMVDPKLNRLLPNLASKYEYSSDKKKLTIYLRKGLKWSDGHDFNADSFEFWFKHHLSNTELTPVLPPEFIGAKFTKVNDHTFYYEFKNPTPYLINNFVVNRVGYYLPGHVLKKYHATFVDKDILNADTEEEGYLNWAVRYSVIMRGGFPEKQIIPTMRSHILVKSSAGRISYSRNPFYFKIDTAGKQLPYIDEVICITESNNEVIAAKTSTGQVDFSAYKIECAELPLFKIGEKSGVVKVLLWETLFGSDVTVMFNLNHKNKMKRQIFNNLKFRKALSFALNREEMNSIIYFGKGKVRQNTVIPTSKFYDQKFEKAFIDYHPDKAHQLLDEIGLKDIDGDGVREDFDGKPLSVLLEWLDFQGPKSLTVELICEYWREVGLMVNHKQVDFSLQRIRATGGLMDVTIWHADRSSDVMFPPEPFWFVPMHLGGEECHWNDWALYNLSDGKKGQKPTGEAAHLFDWWQSMKIAKTEEDEIKYAKKILQSNADNLWVYGLVGMTPKPIVINPRLHNVAPMGYWGFDGRFTNPVHPSTWFFENGRKK